MYLLQTKKGSRVRGGPQYYFHDLTENIALHLRSKGAVKVALVTPYGATKSDFFAVSKDHKLEGDRAIPGRVGHDRIQQGRASGSIGEAIRHWYQLLSGDFARIDVDVTPRDDVFYVTPLSYVLSNNSRVRDIVHFRQPLSFTKEFSSLLWRRQLDLVSRKDHNGLKWAFRDLCRVVGDHLKATKAPYVDERDLLRAGGALSLLGMRLGPYLKQGFDCDTEFEFLDYPPYRVPVEVKRDSTGFKYQQHHYGRDELSRAVVLCAVHRHKTMPDHIDVIELEALCQYGNQLT